MTTVINARLYGRFIEIGERGKELHRTNVRAPIQFRRERQPKHPKR